MRRFPRTARRRALAAGLAAIAIGGLIVPSAEAKHGASHGPSLKDKQQAAHTAVKHAQRELDGQSKELIAAQGALATAEHRLAGAQSHLADVTGRLVAAQKVDARLRAALAVARGQQQQADAAVTRGEDDVASQRAAAQQAVLGDYLQGDPSLHEAQAFLDGQSLDALTSQQAYGAAVSGMQTSSYQSLQSTQVLLTVRKEDASAAAKVVSDREQEAAAEVAKISDLRRQAVDARNQVADLVRTRRGAEARALAAKRHDESILALAKAREDRIERQIFRQAARGANRVIAASGMFYPPVVDTYITSPFGWRIHPIYGYRDFHDGDDLHAPCGTPEHAPQTGRVASEYYSSVWGNRLFLDMGRINGHSWVGIFNHIEHYVAHTGAVVGKGQTVALAGTTGWSTGCHLHFTLMRDGVAVNPADYIHF